MQWIAVLLYVCAFIHFTAALDEYAALFGGSSDKAGGGSDGFMKELHELLGTSAGAKHSVQTKVSTDYGDTGSSVSDYGDASSSTSDYGGEASSTSSSSDYGGTSSSASDYGGSSSSSSEYGGTVKVVSPVDDYGKSSSSSSSDYGGSSVSSEAPSTSHEGFYSPSNPDYDTSSSIASSGSDNAPSGKSSASLQSDSYKPSAVKIEVHDIVPATSVDYNPVSKSTDYGASSSSSAVSSDSSYGTSSVAKIVSSKSSDSYSKPAPAPVGYGDKSVPIKVHVVPAAVDYKPLQSDGGYGVSGSDFGGAGYAKPAAPVQESYGKSSGSTNAYAPSLPLDLKSAPAYPTKVDIPPPPPPPSSDYKSPTVYPKKEVIPPPPPPADYNPPSAYPKKVVIPPSTDYKPPAIYPKKPVVIPLKAVEPGYGAKSKPSGLSLQTLDGLLVASKTADSGYGTEKPVAPIKSYGKETKGIISTLHKTMPALKKPYVPAVPAPGPKVKAAYAPSLKPRTKAMYAVGAKSKSIIPVHGPNYFPKPYTGYFPGADEYSYSAGYKQVYTKMASVPPKPTTGCPYGWLPYDGHCYLVSRDKISWFTASMKCRYMGGYLAVVDNVQENSFLRMIATKYGLNKDVWFGLNDVLFNKIFIWEGGNKQCKAWDWGKGQPNLSGPGYRHCAALGHTCDFQWVVNNCHERNYYVCEFVPGKPCRCDY